MDRMGLSSKRFRTFLVAFSIAFPMFLIGKLLYQNSSFHLFEQSSVVKANGGSAQNFTDVLREGIPNVTAKCLGGKPQNKNITASQLRCEQAENGTTMVVEGRAKRQSITTLDVGLENKSFPPSGIPTEKLLHGLLAPGFDEQSCLSRYQSYLYRKTSSHKPSPYLISKLRVYEDLYKKCGPYSKSYNRTISKLMKSSKNNATTMCKYLVWTAANGLGNRMVSMVAAFLYAVLTNRVLLVEFEADMIGLFCEPFPNSSWLLPWDFSKEIHQKHIQTYESLLKNDKASNSEELSPSFLELNLQHGSDEHERLFHCDHSQNLLQKVPTLILRSDQYFVPSLFMIPSFNQELDKMFQEKDSVFHQLGRYLFHPSNEAWGLISRFYQSYLANADERIGLQIRVFKVNQTPHQDVINEILACTQKHKLLPVLNMQKSETSQLKKQTLKAVLVASLHSEYSQKLGTMYLTKPTVTGEIVGIYQLSYEGIQKFHDNIHNIKAWTEIYLLSLCDVLVTSRKSTFGYVAQSLGGLKPWILQKAKPNMIRNPPCHQAMSMESCFHYPPWHSCMTNTILNVSSVFPRMRHCEDFGWGIKLVNHRM